MKQADIPEMYKSDSFVDINGICIMENSFYDFKSHRHDFYELEYVIEGEGACEINGKSFLLKKGDVSFVTPMDFHSYTGGEMFKTVTVHFQLEALAKELSILSGIEACVINSNNEMREMFIMLPLENESSEHRYLALKNIIELIVIMFLRVNRCERKSDMPRDIIEAVGYINRNFTKRLDLKSISEKCNYSTAYFSRQFKKYTGMGFVEYLTDVRVSHAKNILMNNDVSVTQLSYECGFGSIRSLNRAFFNKYGCSPKEYKRQNSS